MNVLKCLLVLAAAISPSAAIGGLVNNIVNSAVCPEGTKYATGSYAMEPVTTPPPSPHTLR